MNCNKKSALIKSYANLVKNLSRDSDSLIRKVTLSNIPLLFDKCIDITAKANVTCP